MPFRPPISFQQGEILECPKKYLLVDGPRYSSKTIGCLNDIPWHMWNTPGACGMMLGRTTTQNSDAGAWSLLVNSILPKWERGETLLIDESGQIVLDDKGLPQPGPLMPFGFEVVTPVRMEASTHKLYFETNNRFDGVSRYYLDSLDVESDAENKFKGKMFSHIYWTELSNFKQRKTFDVIQECLRGIPDLRPDQYKLVADTNPAEEGEDSWIWKLWFWFRTVDLDNITDDLREELNLGDMEGDELAETVMALKEMQEQLEVHNYTIDDNIFITQAQKRAQRAKYSHDKDLLDRYYYGKWTRSSGDGIFSEVWQPILHLVPHGRTDLSKSEKEEIILPEVECIELGSGADIGSRRNTALAFMEPVLVEVEEFGSSVLKTGIKVLDEFVSLGKQQKIWETAEQYDEKVEFWSAQCKKKPTWLHASDSSSFDVSGQTSTSEAVDIYRLTEGRVELRSILRIPEIKIKGAGGVERGIDLLQRLLFENRFWVNDARCPMTAEMFAAIKRNRKGKLSTTNIYKHIMDAIRYYCSWKLWEEIRRTPRIPTNKERPRIVVTTV